MMLDALLWFDESGQSVIVVNSYVSSDPKDLGTVYSDFSYRVEDFESELIKFENSGYFSYRIRISDLRAFRFDLETSVTDPGMFIQMLFQIRASQMLSVTDSDVNRLHRVFQISDFPVFQYYEESIVFQSNRDH
ncbi:putative UDP-3-O [Dorcoceras hygrometricum]|uniref:Putative UDP-3-O n=1 Tax=Dorcoceras hygrometricum TaxID=472368 RepID=A0A2Z7CJW9_9LAMI|nr:putative UDP-3-O [Dorcoceras hygrometricum]